MGHQPALTYGNVALLISGIDESVENMRNTPGSAHDPIAAAYIEGMIYGRNEIIAYWLVSVAFSSDAKARLEQVLPPGGPLFIDMAPVMRRGDVECIAKFMQAEISSRTTTTGSAHDPVAAAYVEGIQKAHDSLLMMWHAANIAAHAVSMADLELAQ